MQLLKIAMLGPFGIRPKGTLAVRMLPLAQALARRGHQVSIAAPPVHNPEDAGKREVYGGVTVFHTPASTLIGPAGVVQQVGALFKHALADSPDLLHVFKPKGYSGLAALLANLRRPSLPLVVDTDDWEGWGGWNDVLPYPQYAKTLFAWQERDLPRRAATVTVASRTLQTQVWGFGVPPDHVVYLPNGINQPFDEDRHAPAREARAPRTLLLYTRFWEFDVHDVVAALAALVTQQADICLRVVGRGERGEERELLRLAERAGLSRSIMYYGWVESDQLPAHFDAADIALFPVQDTLITRAKCSAKLLELMAAGLPIVAGRVGQVAEYLEHGVSGLLVPPGSAAGLAQGVVRLLHDHAMRVQLGRAARARAAALSWDLLAPLAEQAYERALHVMYGRA